MHKDRNIAIITARSGSKGLPNKNIKELCGKPLIFYSINAAIESKCFDKIFVSTDSKEYAMIAESFGADASFLRSKKTSSDNASSWDVIREVISVFESKGEFFDNIMLLQPTSPLRSSEDITESFELFYKKHCDAVIGVTESNHSPIWCSTIPDDLSLLNFSKNEYRGLPRQKLPKFYRINGAIYLVRKKVLTNVDSIYNNGFAYIMPQQRSIDIDTKLDFVIAEAIMKNWGRD